MLTNVAFPHVKHKDHITYEMDNRSINSNAFMQYLDFIFQDDLSFKEHICRIVASANSKLVIIETLSMIFTRIILLYCIHPLLVLLLNKMAHVTFILF